MSPQPAPPFTNIRLCLVLWALGVFIATLACIILLAMTGVNPTTDFSPAIILVAYAPSLAALAAVSALYGVRGIAWLLKQLTIWRVGVRWYAMALIGPFALVLLANLLYASLSGSAMHGFVAPELGAMMGPLIAGSLGEEIGWRGFAQPLLQKKYSALMAAIIVGILWATWHLWPALAPGGLESLAAADILQTYVRLISTSIVYAWLYNSTRGSLLIVMLAHAAHNVAIDALPLGDGTMTPLIIAFLYLAAALAVIKIAGPQRLASGQNDSL